jgi:predicted regulator of Ras-like GTPase activity (Roadblock/LC7/MglB family)
MIEKKNIALDNLVETRGVKGAYEVSSDGFLLDSLDSGFESPEAVAAVSAVAAITSERIGAGLELGGLKWILLEFKSGKVIIAKDTNKFWVVVGNEHLIFGDILLKLGALKKTY